MLQFTQLEKQYILCLIFLISEFISHHRRLGATEDQMDAKHESQNEQI